jgi:hypothetical protein
MLGHAPVGTGMAGLLNQSFKGFAIAAGDHEFESLQVTLENPGLRQ